MKRYIAKRYISTCGTPPRERNKKFAESSHHCWLICQWAVPDKASTLDGAPSTKSQGGSSCLAPITRRHRRLKISYCKYEKDAHLALPHIVATPYKRASQALRWHRRVAEESMRSRKGKPLPPYPAVLSIPSFFRSNYWLFGLYSEGHANMSQNLDVAATSNIQKDLSFAE